MSRLQVFAVAALFGAAFWASWAQGQAEPKADAATAICKAAGESWTVAYPAKSLPVEKTAAEELAEFVGRAAKLQAKAVAEDALARPDAADAYVGATAYAQSAGVYRPKLPQEAYVLKTQGGKLFIFGDDAPKTANTNAACSGTLFGVYGFLEEYLGVAWIWPGKTGEYVPPHDRLRLPPIDRTEAPDFLIRSFAVGYGKYEGREVQAATGPWLLRMRLSWIPKAWFGHSWGTHVFNHPESKKHPEWMALWGAERRGPHLCTSNPALRDFIVQRVLENARTKGYKIVSISPSDGYGFCECENCRKLDPPGTRYDENPNLSNRHWDYANYVAREVKKREPGLGVGMFAYTAYHTPPTNIEKLEDNIYVSFTFSTAYFVNPEQKAATYRQIDQWKTKGVKIVGREYWGMHYWMDLPYLFTREIAESMPRLHQQGLVAMYGETSKNYATQGPNYYLVTHLMWDAEADADKIIDRFYSAFGPAKQHVRAYYGSLEDTLKRNGKTLEYGYRRLVNSWPELFPQEDLRKAGEHLAAAKKAVEGSPEFRERVRVVEIGHQYTVMMVELLGIYRTLGRAGVPLWNFGPEGDAAEAIHFNLPGGKMVPEAEQFWKTVPRVTLTPEEKLKLLRRAALLGQQRERILDENADLPAVSRGLYQFTVERGIRPWHKTVLAELEKAEPPK